MRELTDDEADTVMANIYPQHRRWCIASCGPAPGDDLESPGSFACACTGCIYGALSWEDFEAWRAREAKIDPTPYVEFGNHPTPSLEQRLEQYKWRKGKQLK